MSSKFFKIGDVVELKSGGQSMTVDEIKQQYENAKPVEGYECRCVWFSGKEIKSEWFDQHSLIKVNKGYSNFNPVGSDNLI